MFSQTCQSLLFYAHFLKKCVYLLDSLHSVHNWHVYVQQNHFVEVEFLADHFFESFEAVYHDFHCEIRLQTQVRHLAAVSVVVGNKNVRLVFKNIL